MERAREQADRTIQEAFELAYAHGRTAMDEAVADLVGKLKAKEFEDAGKVIASVVERIPAGRQRQRIIDKFGHLLHREQRRIEREKKEVEDQRERTILHLRSGVEHLDKLTEWSALEPTLQKPVGSMVADFCDALHEQRVFDLPAKDGFTPPQLVESWLEMASSASIYLVQHDWAGAFRNAKDYLGGEIRLPDDACAFEFRINDRHVIAFATDADGALYQQVAVQVRKGWILFPLEANRPTFGKLHELLNEQVRAVAIALDAEAAVAEVVRAPHRSNRPKEFKPLPMLSYHVVNLSRRTRAAPLDAEAGEPGRKRRLHFRRGHWRHFETHKTWIKWMLVGDPALGFVDKEYRL